MKVINFILLFFLLSIFTLLYFILDSVLSSKISVENVKTIKDTKQVLLKNAYYAKKLLLYIYIILIGKEVF